MRNVSIIIISPQGSLLALMLVILLSTIRINPTVDGFTTTTISSSPSSSLRLRIRGVPLVHSKAVAASHRNPHIFRLFYQEKDGDDVDPVNRYVARDEVYHLGLKPFVSRRKKDDTTPPPPHAILVDKNHQPSSNVTKEIMENEANVNWESTRTDTLLDMKINRKGQRKDMESLLNITMPNPTYYSSRSNNNVSLETSLNGTGTNLEMKANDTEKKAQPDNISSFATSLMDSIQLTTNSTSTKQASNDLYSLAASIMTTPPKMKRITPSTKAPSSTLKINPDASLTTAKPSTKAPTSTLNVNPDATLTIADLERILNESGYVRRNELSNITSSLKESIKWENGTKAVAVKKTKSGLAFPQPSLVSSKHVRIGTSISSSMFATLLAISFRPNLWLIGSVVGAVIGNDIAEKADKIEAIDDSGALAPIPGGLYGDVSLRLGRKIASVYLQVWDLIQGVWFMVRK